MKQTFWARRRKIPLLSYFSCAATQCWLSFTYAQCKVANILGRVLEHEFWTAFHGQPRNSERRHQLLALQEAVPWPGFPIFVFKQVLEQSCWSRAAFLQGPGSGAQSSGQGGHRWAPGCSLASAVCGLHQAGHTPQKGCSPSRGSPCWETWQHQEQELPQWDLPLEPLQLESLLQPVLKVFMEIASSPSLKGGWCLPVALGTSRNCWYCPSSPRV